MKIINIFQSSISSKVIALTASGDVLIGRYYVMNESEEWSIVDKIDWKKIHE